MKAAFALLAVMVASTAAQDVFRNVCKPTEIVFLLDHSENARKASTLDTGANFALLKNAFDNFMRDLAVSGDNLFSIWSWAYSSRGAPVELVRRGTRPSQANGNNIGNMNSGGSWTYTGMQQIKDASSQPNNIIIIISAQGSGNTNRRNLVASEYQRLSGNNWNTYVIGVKASADSDSEEWRLANGGVNAVELDDGRATNKKSYTLLPDALSVIKNTILCPLTPVFVPTTPRPTVPIVTRPRPTMPPATGICSNCKIEGGYGFDRHPYICDLFYQCLPDGTHILKQCGVSLIWDSDNGACVRAGNFTCPTGQCNAALNGATYPSGTCCNMFFACDGKRLVAKQCTQGQVYDETSQSCVVSSDPVRECRSRGSNYCNVRMGNDVRDCGAFKEDPTGNPCRYYHGGYLKSVSAGVVWDQSRCGFVHSDVCSTNGFDNRGLKDMSTQCSAITISTYNNGRPRVESQRDPTLELYAQFNNVVTARDALFFPPGGTSSAYYFFFNNNEIPKNSAFRLVFQLSAQADIGVEYDLFTNNFCFLCPETISATVRKVSSSNCVITTRFTESPSNAVIQTSISVNGVMADGWLDMALIWGDADVHGEVKVLSSSKSVVNKVQIPSTSHTLGANIQPNKCGLLVGAGPNTNFMGAIDEFAYYTRCTNIEDVLTIQTVV